ncbi:hypothetical protein [Aliiroseovarius sp. YM-037]|uniref:hypothetical protein n=1 Tax=Aliiroseovarius sp. YM-037 TaxID=3341728 RepID=UPI003A804B3D
MSDLWDRIDSDLEYRHFLENAPLIAFSSYTFQQAEALCRAGEKLNEISNSWQSTDQGRVIHNFTEYADMFWFWVLGAYEVTRTMKQHADICFSAKIASEIRRLNKLLSILRVPFAKQELRGNKGTISNELSAYKFNKGAVFEVGGQELDSYELIEEVCDFLKGIRLEHIKEPMPRQCPYQCSRT